MFDFRFLLSNCYYFEEPLLLLFLANFSEVLDPKKSLDPSFEIPRVNQCEKGIKWFDHHIHFIADSYLVFPSSLIWRMECPIWNGDKICADDRSLFSGQEFSIFIYRSIYFYLMPHWFLPPPLFCNFLSILSMSINEHH